MRRIEYSGQFQKDVDRAKKRGKPMEKLRAIIELLVDGKQLPARVRDHPLKGDWQGCRDLHIEPDWLLIYSLSPEVIRFERTGTHADLFRK